MPQAVKLSPRLQSLFSRTKLICFGRYAIEVPQEARLIWGSVWFPADIEVVAGGAAGLKRQVEKDIAKLKYQDESAEITYNKEGPVPDSWQIRYYEDETAKKLGLHFFNTYVRKGDLTFVLGGSVEKGNTEEAAAAREASLAKNLRLRRDDEVPTEPGYCIEHAFFSTTCTRVRKWLAPGFTCLVYQM